MLQIVCPRCKTSLSTTFDRLGKCSSCGFVVEHENGVPILRLNPDKKSTEYKGVDLPDLDIEKIALPIPHLRETLGRGRLVLEIGAGRERSRRENLIRTDANPSTTNLHCVADAHALPFADNSFDMVFSMAVFEHLHSPWIAAKEIHRVLKPGGCVYVLTAFMQQLHGSPEHYFNMTESGLRRCFEMFSSIETGPAQQTDLTELSNITANVEQMADRVYRAASRIKLPLKRRWAVGNLRRHARGFAKHLRSAQNDLLWHKPNLETWRKVAPGVYLQAIK